MLQKLLLTVFLALCIVVTFTNAFNLRSDDKSDDVKSADALSNDINDAPASKHRPSTLVQLVIVIELICQQVVQQQKRNQMQRQISG